MGESMIALERSMAIDILTRMPILEVGRLAFGEKRRRYGDRITYTINRHINPTNLCIHSCTFCDFAAKPKDKHAYILDEDSILESLDDQNLLEVHLVGGLWPLWSFERSLNLVRSIRAKRPAIWIKAFTAVEVAYFSKLEDCSTIEILRRLKDAGIDALPGGGAEVLSHRVHQQLYSTKIGPDEWLRIHAECHSLGLPSNCTLLFGHIEDNDEIIEHLRLLRELQGEYNGFASFIPLLYQPGKTKIVSHMAVPERCLRVVALSRLMLDNIPHIKAYWPTLQIETAAVALTFGADDLDGTLGNERIMQLAQSGAPKRLSSEVMEQIIRDSGQQPVRRGGNFVPVACISGKGAQTDADTSCK